MRAADLMLRYTIITIAWHLACAWIQTFNHLGLYSMRSSWRTAQMSSYSSL